ncbi:cylicin-2 isoform X2 [Glycine max]|nr:cylicin-2 isoform X2 [Glycine max]
MRRKSRGKRRRAASATTLSPSSLSAIPILWDAYDTICIHCNNKGEEAKEDGLLICSGRGCPVAVHATCLATGPKFDGSGNFCCPYCWYKRAVDTCRRLREKALEAKGDLSRFLDNHDHARAAAHVDLVVQDSEELMEETGTQAQSKDNKDEEGEARVNQVHDREETETEPEGNKEKEGKVRDNEELVEERERKTVTEAQSQENKAEEDKFQDDSEELVVETETETEVQCEENKEEGKVRDSEEHVEEMETETGAEAQPEEKKDEGKVRDSEKLVEETQTETEGQSEEKKDEEGKVAVMSSSVSETYDSDSVAVSMKKRKDKKKKVTSARKSLSLQQEHKNKHYKTRGKVANEEEVTSFKTTSLGQQPQRMKQSSLAAKRKRLLWTAEEEKVLKVQEK